MIPDSPRLVEQLPGDWHAGFLNSFGDVLFEGRLRMLIGVSWLLPVLFLVLKGREKVPDVPHTGSSSRKGS